ncbi:nitroreductase [Pokkaliibacter sp. CJK22405]|uniref:nitroreductase family protein n=1 Tax=Pokkaliibacter sp. CJK22405 TaxID=3384615 RepID=UPI003984D4D5
MDALSLLENRVSFSKLGGEAPTPEQRALFWKAAMRAPDHGGIHPWRFIEVEGEARMRLGEVFAQVAMENDPDAAPEFLEKCLNMPLRAPLLIVVVACYSENPKVPRFEQMLSAGAAAQNILLSAFAQGLGAIWRTGWVAEDASISRALGLKENEQNIGMLYVGQPAQAVPSAPVLNAADHVSQWKGE